MKDTHEQERKALQESAKKNFVGGLLTLTGSKSENKEVIEKLFESMSDLIKVLAKKRNATP